MCTVHRKCIKVLQSALAGYSQKSRPSPCGLTAVGRGVKVRCNMADEIDDLVILILGITWYLGLELLLHRMEVQFYQSLSATNILELATCGNSVLVLPDLISHLDKIGSTCRM